MEDWSCTLTTQTGARIHLRPASPEDDALVAQFFKHVTPEDMRFRFLSGMKEVGPSQVRALTHIDHHQTEDFLAFGEDRATMVATAMLACDAAMERGEVAITIRDDQKQMGIGWALLAHIADYAKMRGVGTLESAESRDNHSAIELEREMGFTTKPYPDDPTLVLVSRTL